LIAYCIGKYCRIILHTSYTTLPVTQNSHRQTNELEKVSRHTNVTHTTACLQTKVKHKSQRMQVKNSIWLILKTEYVALECTVTLVTL